MPLLSSILIGFFCLYRSTKEESRHVLADGLSTLADLLRRQAEAKKREAVQKQLGEQIEEVKQRHRQEIADEMVIAKMREEDAAQWKSEQARLAAQKQCDMHKLKVGPEDVSSAQNSALCFDSLVRLLDMVVETFKGKRGLS